MEHKINLTEEEENVAVVVADREGFKDVSAWAEFLVKNQLRREKDNLDMALIKTSYSKSPSV